MNYILRYERGVLVAICSECHTALRIGSGDIVFCPKCGTTLKGAAPVPIKTLCCTECYSYLRVTGDGSEVPRDTFCITCRVSPPIEHTFLFPTSRT